MEVASSNTTMHECFAGLPLSPRSAALISPRTTFPCHPHDSLRYPLVSSRTAGSGSRGLESLPIPSRSSRAAPPAPPLLFKNSCPQVAGPSPNHDRLEPLSILPLSLTLTLLATVPPDRYICSKELVYNTLASFPRTPPFRASGSSLFLRSSPPPETAPPGCFPCSKRPVYKIPGSLPQSRPFLASGSTPVLA